MTENPRYIVVKKDWQFHWESFRSYYNKSYYFLLHKCQLC